MAEVRIGEEAEAEYTEALTWYSSRSTRAADGFEAAFAVAIEQIGQTPERFPECDEVGYRYAVLSGYPYSAIDRRSGEEAQVIAVAHASRRPGYGSGRV